ncbi:MAG: serine hydrolase, partial [Gemmatimonadaceae bacterium]
IDGAPRQVSPAATWRDSAHRGHNCGMPVYLRSLVAATVIGFAIGCVTSRQSAPQRSRPGGIADGIATADLMIEASLGRLVPGAVLLVARDGKVLYERAYGYAELNDYSMRRLPSPRRMLTTTVFDLASVTKVMATTFAVMILSDRGQLDIDAPVYRYLPDFRGPQLDSITIRHLLTHSSGLVQWQPLYYQAANSAQTYAAIRGMPLGWGVGQGRHYSDLGFMLLGYVVEGVSGRPLDAFVDAELYEPLGLRSTTFSPRQKKLSEFAATEQGNVYERHMVYDSTFGYRYRGDPKSWNGWRQHVLVGEVDDGNAAYANGGVAGHAGLFSTAAELRVLIDLINNRGSHNGSSYIRPATVDRFLTRDRFQHYLGWQFPAGMPDGSFSHSGFTGTWVVGVPKHKLSIVLLTNRQNLGTNAAGFFPDLTQLREAVTLSIVNGAESGR